VNFSDLGFPQNWEDVLKSLNTADYSYNYHIREMKTEEYTCLEEFLYHAIYVPEGSISPDKSIIQTPELQIYIKDFGTQKHDKSFVAVVDNRIIAATWVRIMKDYGNIDDNTPSLAISVLKEFRNLGIGTALLKTMVSFLRVKGYTQVSLSVQKDNYAFDLYKKEGFVVLKETSEEYIMVCKL